MCVGMNGDSSERQESYKLRVFYLKRKNSHYLSHNNALRDKLKTNKANSNFQNWIFPYSLDYYGWNIIVTFFFNSLFYIGVYLINKVVIVSAVQQSDSVIHIHVSIVSEILFPLRLLHDTEQISLCYIGSFVYFRVNVRQFTSNLCSLTAVSLC